MIEHKWIVKYAGCHKDEILDIFCMYYNDLTILCNEYGMQLPKANDLGYVKNYLSDNFDEILGYVNQCYCGVVVEEIQNILRKEVNSNGKNKKPND